MLKVIVAVAMALWHHRDKKDFTFWGELEECVQTQTVGHIYIPCVDDRYETNQPTNKQT